jgi:hypothetical protein
VGSSYRSTAAAGPNHPRRQLAVTAVTNGPFCRSRGVFHEGDSLLYFRIRSKHELGGRNELRWETSRRCPVLTSVARRASSAYNQTTCVETFRTSLERMPVNDLAWKTTFAIAFHPCHPHPLSNSTPF